MKKYRFTTTQVLDFREECMVQQYNNYYIAFRDKQTKFIKAIHIICILRDLQDASGKKRLYLEDCTGLYFTIRWDSIVNKKYTLNIEFNQYYFLTVLKKKDKYFLMNLQKKD